MSILGGCGSSVSSPVQWASGVKKVTVKVPTNADGLTAEQQNIRDRLLEDNKPGSIKHLDVISAYSGQHYLLDCSRQSDKRRKAAHANYNRRWCQWDFRRPGFPTNFEDAVTDEVLQDDDDGSSTQYLYWWDTKGVYHQHYVSGGQIVHVSNQPVAVKGIIINMEVDQKPEAE